MEGNSNISTHNRREAMDKVIVIARIRLFVVCENIILFVKDATYIIY